MADNFDVLLQLILDREEKEAAKKGLSEIDAELGSIEKSAEDASKAAKKLGGDIDKGMKQAEKSTTKVGNAADDTAKKFDQSAAAMQARAQMTAVKVSIIGDALDQVGKRGLLLSAGFLTGIFAFASKYVNDADEATAVTRAWQRETDSLSKSGERIGAVLAEQILPLLGKAADVAETIAGLIEKNPELANAAINTAVIIAGLSSLASVTGKLLQVVAFVQSASSFSGAAAAGGTAAAGGGAAAVGSAALVVAAPVLGAILAKEIGNALQRALGQQESTWADIGNTLVQAIQIPTKLLLLALRDLGLISPETAAKLNEFQNELFDFGVAANKVADEVAQAAGVLRGSEFESQIVDAFSKMKQAEAAEEKSFQADRKAIIADANAAILSLMSSNAKAIADINAKAAADRAKIISDFITASNEAERQYAQARSRAISQANEDIARLEQDRLDRLAELEQEHADRVEDLTANRDALGLVLEQRNFEREQETINAESQKAIAQRRRDLAIQLADMAASHAAERAQRLAAYQQALKENEEKRVADLKAQQDQYIQEMREIQINRANRLRELQMQHNEERNRIRENFLAQVRDLDASLLGEQQKKRQYYALMLSDAEKFLADYRARLPSSGNVPQYANGGYTPNGLIRSHENEFISNQSTTRALEALIGGKLNQQALLQAVARGSMQSVVWNDRRRFSGEYTMSMRREVQRDSVNVLAEAFS